MRDLINNKEYVEFLIGRDGEFDLLVSSAIKRAVKDHGYSNTALVLVLPYDRAEYTRNMESFEEYYDEIEICSESSSAHYKAAIGIRNATMVDRAELVICAVEREHGGAYRAMLYARQQGKREINLLDGDCYEK